AHGRVQRHLEGARDAAGEFAERHEAEGRVLDEPVHERRDVVLQSYTPGCRVTQRLARQPVAGLEVENETAGERRDPEPAPGSGGAASRDHAAGAPVRRNTSTRASRSTSPITRPPSSTTA